MEKNTIHALLAIASNDYFILNVRKLKIRFCIGSVLCCTLTATGTSAVRSACGTAIPCRITMTLNTRYFFTRKKEKECKCDHKKGCSFFYACHNTCLKKMINSQQKDCGSRITFPKYIQNISLLQCKRLLFLAKASCAYIRSPRTTIAATKKIIIQ